MRWRCPSRRSVAWQSQIVTAFEGAARAGFGAYVRRFFLRPTWKSLPFAMALVCAGAALLAPAVARFVGYVLDLDWGQVFRNPEKMSDFARLDGACQALCCYLFGILPLEYLRPRLRRFHKAVTYCAAFGGAILGALMGQLFLTVGKVNELLGGVHALRAPPPTGRVVALSFAMTISGLLLMLLVRTVMAEAEVREHALAEAAALAKAHALQSQINPHFFFNTLTTVSALADLDSRAAKELVGQLAELFRYTLSCSRFDMVTLAQELEFVKNYLLIEQARFRRRLRFEMPDRATEADVYLPGLTLQPIVENAIRHGISRRREGGTVKIGVERIPRREGVRNSLADQSVWVVSVANQIPLPEAPPSFDEKVVFRPGHALANTRERLALAFPGRAKIEFLWDGEEWVKVALTIPAAEAT
jgi:hypothetical protein